MKIAALVSGGVDSSVVVHQLKEQGYDPTIFYIRIGMEDKDGYIDCPAEEDIEITTYIAKRYGCKMEVVSLHEEYWDNVVSYTIEAVKRGLTPNPDMMCNKMIKFGYFDQKWGHEYDKIATGHYATTTELNGKTWLSTAKDKVKDQTDFLAQVTPVQISKLMFPIGHLLKSEVRAIAAEQALPSAKRKDSQGICFLGKIDYNDFIRRYLGEKEGLIVELETGKIIGRHKGYWFHTIGQRKGLGLSGGPWYVIKKDIDRNIIYVSNGYDPETQYGKVVNMSGFSFITEDIWGDFEGRKDITFKIRHTPEFTKGQIEKIGDLYRIHSEEKIQGIAAGQFGVVYDADSHLCIGSGEIVLEK
ncbi:tRNA 2-thiouridine(34) synthase MnmA [Dysgonomonas sp. 25]|uniref:tRNA 2-thiouridine(34) synthase MnmA n=1 Tax=Dysgonomonas sp. 25 TaxID=2302933 RepID=UPI0013D5A1CD|nr:tRNA 2-thiouridine(34) synthase MnmA [Dysgonomonas sp. 25]NDV69643.1 tRNA 2-thiouridine(34) synthase MnmA [Dysgonomonas sp. 25]